MKSVNKVLLVAGVFSLVLALNVSAQVQTETSTTSGKATKEVQVERGEVVTVAGNDLVVKMEDGTIRHFPNVPESARVTVDGRQLGIHDLKPGMKLQRTITTTTTPQLITTVQTVTRIGVVCEPAEFRYSDPRERPKPPVQNPKGVEI